MKWDRSSDGSIITIYTENPDLPGRGFAIAIVTAGLILFLGYYLSGSAHEEYSYKFGHTSPAFRGLVSVIVWIISGFLIFGGLALALVRSGITIDRKRRQVAVWSNLLAHRSCTNLAFGQFDRILVKRSSLPAKSSGTQHLCRIEVILAARQAENLSLGLVDADMGLEKHALRELSDFLGLPLVAVDQELPVNQKQAG